MQYVNASGRDHYRKTEYIVKPNSKRLKRIAHGQAVHIAKTRPNLTAKQISVIVNRPYGAIRCLLHDSGLKTGQTKKLTREQRESQSWSVNVKSQAMLRRPISEWAGVLEVLK